MPYTIYTYADPYRIAEADFWPDIQELPHLCSSRTLVNGMVDVMQDSIHSLICPLDEIIDEKRVYRSWTKNITGQIQQYGYLTSVYARMQAEGELDGPVFSALHHNKNAMLESLRLFMELGIPAASLHEEAANKEQRLFIRLLRQIQETDDPLFRFPPAPSLETVRAVMREKACQEKQAYEERAAEGKKQNTGTYQKRMAMYDRAIAATGRWNGKRLVIHGVHQFSPVQLRFILSLEQKGVEIIFLHNFQEQYPAMYSSWNYIYQYFGARTHADQKVKTYQLPGQLPRPGHALAEAMARMCQEGGNRPGPAFRSNFALYRDMKVQCFENVSEYAGYISDRVDEARAQLEKERPLYARPQGKIGTAAVLSRMDELIYTANKDVEELLQIYYPEYSRNRHFLAYPIGQFFSALYRLWDGEKGEIRVHYGDIRECLNSGILPRYQAAELLKTAMNLEPLFENVTTYTELIQRLRGEYLPRYREVNAAAAGGAAFPFQVMTIYQQYKVSEKNVTDFIGAMESIQAIAAQLFAAQGQKSGISYLSFRKHFEELEKFLKERQPELADEEERDLIAKLLVRFEEVRLASASNEMQGTFEDLKNGIYFFLKQKEKPDPNWLVKNFEQIDGDILGSKKQNRPGQNKVYHFACVSDRDMNQSVNDLLPWPLSERFIERAYTPVDLQFQVYYAALCERSAFLRYCLFYGLYYNQCDSCLSYVRQYGDACTEAYNLLRLLGVGEQPVSLAVQQDDTVLVSFLQGRQVTHMPYDRYQMMAMFLCPYKYLFDYVLNPQPGVAGAFSYGNLFENVLVSNLWQRLAGQTVDQAARRYRAVLRQEADRIKRFFPFWNNRSSEFSDLVRRADNYFRNCVVTKEVSQNRQGVIPSYKESHMKMRQLFGRARFDVENTASSAAELPGAFENLLKNHKKTYSLHALPKPEERGKGPVRDALLAAAMDYLNHSATPEQRAGEWCYHCGNRDICLRSYAPDAFDERD